MLRSGLQTCRTSSWADSRFRLGQGVQFFCRAWKQALPGWGLLATVPELMGSRESASAENSLLISNVPMRNLHDALDLAQLHDALHHDYQHDAPSNPSYPPHAALPHTCVSVRAPLAQSFSLPVAGHAPRMQSSSSSLKTLLMAFDPFMEEKSDQLGHLVLGVEGVGLVLTRIAASDLARVPGFAASKHGDICATKSWSLASAVDNERGWISLRGRLERGCLFRT